jgi:hypothetical protein
MITLMQAKNLRRGTTLYHVYHRQGPKKAEPERWKVNGQPKTWKRSPERIQIPVKHGMYGFGYITERDLDLVCLTAKEALTQGKD